ncbi:MAG: COQ9 family protein [Aestuariivita sp.]|nr:COQ9 family protein [Aestuariivita sp.]MCY4348064.1 COQ9 family protein [Aestuariivita sp.]
MTYSFSENQHQILDAVLQHVPFEGWSEAAFRAGLRDLNLDLTAGQRAYPRGGIGLAVAFHRRGDAVMAKKFNALDVSNLRLRDKITTAVRTRLEAAENKEAVRRATTLFSLPMNSIEGAQLIWDTCDRIWRMVGDTSNDINWYSKRAILVGVYSSTLLYWLGDDSPDHSETWRFLDRRIDNVMQFEAVKARVKKAPLMSSVLAGPNWLMSRIKAPRKKVFDDLPGHWSKDEASR